MLPEPAARGCVIQDGGFPPSALIRPSPSPAGAYAAKQAISILALQRNTKLILDLYLSTPYGYASPTEGLAPCSVTSMVRWQRRLARAGRAGACSSAGNPVLPEGRTEEDRRKYRKYRKPPCRNPAPSISSTISGASVYPPGGRFAPDGPAEMGGNRRKLPAKILLGIHANRETTTALPEIPEIRRFGRVRPREVTGEVK